MTFVNELIPEAEKDKFPFPVFTRTDGSKPTLWKWTIDRERSVYLVCVKKEGGSYEGTPETRHYILKWKENLISFAGESVITGRVKIDQAISWHIHHLAIPPSLINRKDKVLILIREALEAMGWLYDRECLVAVNVNFDIPLSH